MIMIQFFDFYVSCIEVFQSAENKSETMVQVQMPHKLYFLPNHCSLSFGLGQSHLYAILVSTTFFQG